LGLANDPELTRRVHRESARRAREAGVNFLLSPVADVDRPGNPVIGIRAFGDESKGVSAQVAAAVRGLHEGGVFACVKHWPGHGSPGSDSHREGTSIPLDLQEWERVDLPPFQTAVSAKVPALMVGHLAFPAQDESGTIAPLSHRILAECRKRLRFQGVLVSDALEMAGFAGAAPVAALDAGLDLLLYSKPVLSIEEELKTLEEQLSTRGDRTFISLEELADPPRSADAEVYARARTSGMRSRGRIAWQRRSWILWDGVSGDRLYPFADGGAGEQAEATKTVPQAAADTHEPSLGVSLARALEVTARKILRWDPHGHEFQSDTKVDGVPWPEKGEGLLIASLRPLPSPLLEALKRRLGESPESPSWVICLGVLPVFVTESRTPWLHLPGLCEEDFKLLSPILQGGVDRGQPRC
jgi:hypothetical protein